MRQLGSLSVLAFGAVVVLACNYDDQGYVPDGGLPDGGGQNGGAGGSVPGGTGPFDHALCRAPYPAQACNGDPHGKWTLAALCVNRWESCPGARVTVTGTAMATIDFQDGSPEAYYDYQYDYDTERRLSVPASCLNGASCESIGCFAGDDPCSCVLGSSRGGSTRAEWTPNINGEVVVAMSSGNQTTMLRFCAGATTADSSIAGTRLVWNRVCTDGMDCRPSNPCHIGKATCGAGGITCEDSGSNRATGTACGTDKVCDATGNCVACAAGAACQPEGQPCKTGIVSCRTATPVCTVSENVKDGTSCGDNRTCMEGVCKAADGVACTSDNECKDSCTCGDPQCQTRFCGRSCPCQYASPGGACTGVLADGAQDPSSCNKACFKGRCLTEVGQRCTRDNECGSGHCTCWLPNCSGGRLCSKLACPCQWARSGADECGGPLMDGLQDFSCQAPQMCVSGMCQ